MNIHSGIRKRTEAYFSNIFFSTQWAPISRCGCQSSILHINPCSGAISRVHCQSGGIVRLFFFKIRPPFQRLYSLMQPRPFPAHQGYTGIYFLSSQRLPLNSQALTYSILNSCPQITYLYNDLPVAFFLIGSEEEAILVLPTTYFTLIR